MTSALLSALIEGIDRVLPDAAALRRAIHAEPHLSGEEEPTRDTFIRAAEWTRWTPVAHTGAWARLGPSGPRITGISPVKSTAPTA